MPKGDPRYHRLRRGLSQLTSAQLRKVLRHPAPMVFDAFNYCERTQRF